MSVVISEEEYNRMKETILNLTLQREKMKMSQKLYISKNKEKINANASRYVMNRYNNDPEFRLQKQTKMKEYNAKKRAEKKLLEKSDI